MDSSLSPKDEIWFLRVCHHISTGVYSLWTKLYKVILEDRSMLSVTVILYIWYEHVCNSEQLPSRDVWISRHTFIRSFFVGSCDKWSLQKKGGYIRQTAGSHEGGLLSAQRTRNTRSSYFTCKVHWRWRWNFRIFIVNCNKYVILIINNKFTYIKFHIKTFNIAPTCFDPKIILRSYVVPC